MFFINHCADLRLEKNTNTTHLVMGYFGHPDNVFINADIAGKIRMVYTSPLDKSTFTTDKDWIPLTYDVNAHYAIRKEQSDPAYKPFTKGFNAACCAANILVHADDGDAKFFLGDDYPYLIKEPLSEAVVLDYIEKMESGFGSKEWYDGLQIMDHLREVVSHRQLTSQFLAMLEHFVL